MQNSKPQLIYLFHKMMATCTIKKTEWHMRVNWRTLFAQADPYNPPSTDQRSDGTSDTNLSAQSLHFN